MINDLPRDVTLDWLILKHRKPLQFIYDVGRNKMYLKIDELYVDIVDTSRLYFWSELC